MKKILLSVLTITLVAFAAVGAAQVAGQSVL